ncbi:hypothetical protein [Rubrivirga sp.]|uniref:hypothetical protein n=1 Tax=Rubrivirga sp. TaxID=1885344 RepID=UPI003B519C18
MSRSPLALFAVVLALSGCDTVGEVPTFDELRSRYGSLAESTFRLYDAEADSTYVGPAAYIVNAGGDGFTGLSLLTADYDENSLSSGIALSLSSEQFRSPEVGDQFDVLSAYNTFTLQFNGSDGQVEVTAVTPTEVSGVFWVAVRPSDGLGIGRRIVEGGFRALHAAEQQ